MTRKNPIATVMVWNGRILMVGAACMWLLPVCSAVTDPAGAVVAWQFWALCVMPLLWLVPGFLMQRLGAERADQS